MINWFEHLYPYTNVHELNLDWVLGMVKNQEESIKNFVGSSVIKYAVPIQWDITRQYERNTVVIDAVTGDAYVSIAPVPVGYDLSHTEFWMKVFTLGNQLATLEAQLAHNEGNSTRASIDYTPGQLVFINDLLYITTTNIPTHTLFDEDTNIAQITMEDFIKGITGNLSDLDTANKSNVVSAINENVSRIDGNTSRIDILTNRKYVFIGDSYNTSNHHGGWGAGVISKLGLTEGVDVWNSGLGGASFYAGTFLAQLQTVAASMTADEKNSITDVVIEGAVNDNGTPDGVTLGNAVQAVDSFITTTFPNAKYWLILAGWSYETASIRANTLNAYNLIKEYNVHARIVEAYSNFICHSFLESDMVHPSTLGMNTLVASIVSILNGGEAYHKEYTDFTADFGGLIFKGHVGKDGVHVYKADSVGITFDNAVTVPAPSGSPLLIGTADVNHNYLFERGAVFEAECMYALNNYASFKRGRITITVEHNSNHTWSLYVNSNEIVNGMSDYPVTGVNAMYITTDVTIDFYNN